MKRYAIIFLLAAAIVARAQDEPVKSPATKRERPPLSDEQRTEMEQHANEAWNKLPLEAKTRVLRLHRALTQLPPEERKFINERIERFLNMSPDEKQQLKKNAEHWKNMTLEERQKAREQFRQHRQEFEQKWRQEHPGEEPPPFLPHSPRPPPPPTDNSETKTETPTKETP
jgi:hypothetical protein